MAAAPSARELRRLRAAAEVLRAADAKRSAKVYLPHTPTVKQAEFLELDCLEAFYGGAAGGGKSDALLMAALQHVHVPGYTAMLLRKTFADLALPGAIMERSHEWLHGTGATWNERDKRWTFPSVVSTRATLSFGYMETERDKYRYQGAELQFVGVDEITQWLKPAYLYLLSRLRRLAGVDVPLRARSAGNPGNVGHRWVKERFVESTDAERRFVAANLGDNPHLDHVEYRRALAQLDSVTRRQLEEGIWVNDGSGLVYRFDPKRNTIAELPELTTYIIAIDYGFTDECGFVIVGWREHDPNVYIVEAYKKGGMTPSKAAEEAQLLSEKYRPVRMVGDTGGLGKGYVEEARARFSLPIEAADKVNKRGYIDLLNGDLERGRIKLAPSCTQLVEEWDELPWAEDRSKEAPGFANHCSDAALYAWRATSAYHEGPKAALPTREQVAAAAEARILEQLEAQVQRQQSEGWWER